MFKCFLTKRFKIAFIKKGNNLYVESVFYYMNIKVISDGTLR